MKKLIFLIFILLPNVAHAEICELFNVINNEKKIEAENGLFHEGTEQEYHFYVEDYKPDGWLDYAKGLAEYSTKRFHATWVKVFFFYRDTDTPYLDLSYAEKPYLVKGQKEKFRVKLYDGSKYTELSQDHIKGAHFTEETISC